MMLLAVAVLFALNILDVQSLPQSTSFDAPRSGNCICTPFFRCYDLETSTDLNGVVDDRISIIDDRQVITARQENEPAVCQDPLDICCRNLVPSSSQTQTQSPSQINSERPINFPSSQPQLPNPSQIPTASPIAPSGSVPLPIDAGMRQPIVSHEECGVRNIGGVGFTVAGSTEGQAQYGEFPWIVALLSTNTGFGADMGAKNLYVGGGSLIDPQVVLTVAHKFLDNEINKTLTVRVGEWNIQAVSEPTQHQDIPVIKVIFHPRFDRLTRTYNYALLILEQPAILGETVRTICLPSNPGQSFDDQQCIIRGWGKDIFGEGGRFQRILKSVSVNMVRHSQCQSALQTTHLGTNFNLHRSFVCAGDQGQDACTGDGGSPLVCPDPTSPGQYVQVGVSAWGIGCNQQGIPGVYSAVDIEAVDWIQETLDIEFNITAEQVAAEQVAEEQVAEEQIDDRTVIRGAARCRTCHRYSSKTSRCHRRFRCKS